MSFNHNISQVSNKPFSPPIVSDRAHAEAAPGPHPKLIREAGGRLTQVVRLPNGTTERRVVHVFEGSVIA